MNGRRLCEIALALAAGAAMAVSSPALAAGRGGGGGGGGMHGGAGMHSGGFHGHDGFHHDGFHHHHSHVAFFVGGGFWPGWWGYPYDGWAYPAAYADYYAPVPQYVERDDGADGSSANAWWYRCDQPSGYFPYVKDCPGGWQTVPAQPSP